MRGRLDELTAAYDDVAEHARRAGLPSNVVGWQATGRCMGTTPVPELLAWIDGLDPAERRNSFVRSRHAIALAMAGRSAEAREVLDGLREELRDRGDLARLGQVDASDTLAVAELAGDLETAAVLGEVGCRSLEEQGDRSLLSTYASKLARVLSELGRLDEAEPWAELGRELGAEEDQLTQIIWRAAKAKVLARRGETEAATRLAREAVQVALTTDMLDEQGNAYADLGEVLALAGDPASAGEAYEQALDCYERKGNVVSAERTREKLAGLGAPAS